MTDDLDRALASARDYLAASQKRAVRVPEQRRPSDPVGDEQEGE